MKKWISAVLAAIMTLSLCACGGEKAASSEAASAAPVSASEQEETVSVTEAEEDSAEAEEIEAMDSAENALVDVLEEAEEPEEPEAHFTVLDTPIDLFTEDGTGELKYSGCEYLPDGVMTDENYADAKILAVLMDYTNTSDDPKMQQDDFWYRAYQNGVELDSSFGSYNPDLYEPLSDYFKEVMMGGTVTTGQYFLLEDDSPVTIIANEQGNNDNKQSMTISLTDDGTSDALGDLADQTNADGGLYGTWAVTSVDTSSNSMTVEEMDGKGLHSWCDWKLIVADDGKLVFQTNNSTSEATATVDDTSVTAGEMVWNLVGNQLVCKTTTSTIYYDKVSDDQTFPSPSKSELVEILKAGTWKTSAGDGEITFSDDTIYIANSENSFDSTMSIDMEKGQIYGLQTVEDKVFNITFDYTYDNGTLALYQKGNELEKE